MRNYERMCSRQVFSLMYEPNINLPTSKTLQLTSALLSPTASDLQMTNNNQLIDLIKELASANNKLKSDLLDCSDLLMECRSDLYAKQDNNMHHDDNNNYNDQNNDGCSRLSTSAPQKSTTILDTLPRLSRNQQKDETGTIVSQENTPESSSVPIVHHHYHYYMRNKLLAEKGKNKTSAVVVKPKSDQVCIDLLNVYALYIKNPLFHNRRRILQK